MGMLRKASLSDPDMDIVKEYGKYIEKTTEKDPAHALRQILFGLRLEQYKLDHHPDPKLPSALQGLNREATRCVRSTLAHPETTAWTNIFAPVELLMSFGLQAMSMECIASYLSGFLMENYFIDRAQDAGIAETLCSYHKNFIGAASTGLLPRPLSAVTTSLACDGNVSTFRYLRDTGRIDDFFLLDIPYEDSPAAEDYVTEQLRQYVAVLEEKTGKPYDEQRLRQQIRRENLSHQHYLSFLQKRMTHAYPSTPGMVLFLLLASHLYIGSEWVLKFFEHMDAEIDAYPACDPQEKHLFWMHLSPYAEPSLNRWLSYDTGYAITADDFNLDYVEEMDEAHPLNALSRKMIRNLYNGPFERKAQGCLDYVRRFRCDGAVQFCHWGCKQSAGSALLMKKRMAENGTPMLILDSDALDRRNMQDGQISTRFEAFTEVLKAGGGK